MELIYYWINKDRCIYQQGFCFSPEYRINMVKINTNKWKLTITKSEKDNVFKAKVISNLTAVVGNNGAGKTTLLRNVLSLNCYPLEKDSKEEYERYTDEENENNKNLIVLKENDELVLYTNIYKNEIEILDKGIFKDILYLSDIKENIAGENIKNNMAYCAFTKIYISNNGLDEIDGMGSHIDLDNLIITSTRLSYVSSMFFEFVYPEKMNRKEEHNDFDKYSRWLKKNKSPREFQQICDLLFYNFLSESGFINSYEGFVQTQIRIRIHDMISFFQSEHEDYVFNTKIVEQIEEKYDWNIAKDDLIYILKSNLIYEWCLLNGCEILEGVEDINEIYEKLVDNKCRGKEVDYFENAIKEIKEFSCILEKIPNTVNSLPKSDLGYKFGKETQKYSIKEILKASAWKEVISFVEQRAKANKENREYGSFLLRYLIVDNLNFSSGERAFQNLMSWMFFVSRLDNYIGKKEYHTRHNIIVCFDEIDLNLHPAWQRDIVARLIELIEGCYTDKRIQIIMSTHSPLCLSDIPRENIIYLKRGENGTYVDKEEHKQTFGTNLYEILDDAFYLGCNSMGSFAKKYIKELIEKINKLSVIDEKEYVVYRNKIEYIGDPFIRHKLERQIAEMLEERMEKEYDVEIINREIERLEKRKQQILEETKNDPHNL